MCCCSSSCSVIFAGVWCLIQSIVWAVLAFLGISLYTCDIEVEFELGNPTHYLYFIYFFNRECASLPDELDLNTLIDNALPPGVTIPPDFTFPPDFTLPSSIPPGYTLPPEISLPPNFTFPPDFVPFPIPSWPEKFGPVDRTHTVMLSYAILNTAWAVTCLITVVAGVMNVRRWFAYVPWMLLTAANIIHDVVATINFASDVEVSQSAQGLIEDLIGVDLSQVPQNYKDKLFNTEELKKMDDYTMIPSLVMLLLSIRVGIIWLLNVLSLICVTVAILLFCKEKGKDKNQTYRHNRPYQQGISNNCFVEEPNNRQPDVQYDYHHASANSRPFSYTGGGPKALSTFFPQPLTNNNQASIVAVPAANLNSPRTEPYYVEITQPNPRYQQKPSAPTDYYGQPLNRVPAPSQPKTHNAPGEQGTAPHTHPTDSERSSQPPVQNTPGPSITIPRADVRPNAPQPDKTYLEHRQGHQTSVASSDYYEIPPLPRLPAPGNLNGHNGPAEQRKEPHMHRTNSDRPPNRLQPSTTNQHRPPTNYEEAKPLERKSSQTPQDRPQDPTRDTSHRLSGSMPRPSGSLPPDELRSQLPWSYFGPRDAQMKPKLKQEPLKEEELEMPPVPVPDYTLHFGKSRRPFSQWSDDGASSTAPHVADHGGN